MEKENDKAYRLQVVAEYRALLDSYFRYIPWFQERMGRKLGRLYDGDADISHTIAVPVYDSTLLSFVKGIQDTGLINRNYPYIYSQHNIHDLTDELAWIARCELQDIEVILGIVSKYVLGGMTRGQVWNDAVEDGIFYHALVRIQEILGQWTDHQEQRE
ncbi:MAG: hypothetical protein LBI54_07970 [Lachnospiraceae bacterium]|jgi:hypothetical protein|nr:hypothetical protein [Lachnospiraceae bacterium]